MKITLILALFWMSGSFFQDLLAQDALRSNITETDSSFYLFNQEDAEVNIPFKQKVKNELPGFFTTINPEDFLMYDNISSLGEALSGRVPGIIQGTNIHGLGSALVIIDGIPGDINSVNIEEIEQITVLKDINSSILYGSQAGRGVILVTTKRGKANKKVAELIVDQGFGVPVVLPNYFNAADYMELYNEALANDGQDPKYLISDIEATRNGTNPYRFPDKDYYTSEFLRSSKPFSRYMLNFSGGNLNTQYSLHAGWVHEGNLLEIGEKEQTNNLNIRANVNFRVNDFIKAHIDIVGLYNIHKGPNGDFWGDASSLYPNAYTSLIDTSLVTNKDVISGASIINGQYVLGGTNQYQNNIYGNLYLSGFQRTYMTTLQYNNGVDVDLKSITKGLSFKAYGSFGYNANFTEAQNNEYAVYQPAWADMGGGVYNATLSKIGLDRFTGTQGLSNTYKNQVIGFYGMLDYNRTFGDRHALSGSLLGYTNSSRETNNLVETKNNHLGSRLTYVYNGRYIIDFSSVLTTSLYLKPENRKAFSPSLGLGWVLSNEDFFGTVRGIDYLKFKFSAGILNTDINITDYYLYKSSFTTGGLVTWDDGQRRNNQTMISNIGNDNITYEQRINYNLGAEAVFLNRSIWLDVNLFRETEAGLITQRISSTPQYFGGIYPYDNYGEDQYTGVDLDLSFRKAVNNLRYELGGNFTYLSSEVVKTDEIHDYDYQYRTGKRTDAIFGYQAEGLFSDDADIASHEVQSFGTVMPGDIKYIDQNDDQKVDQNDAIMIGNSLPDFSFGIHLRLSYGNLSFFALATGSYGAERYFNSRYYWVYGDRKYSEAVLNRWTTATAATATYPRLSSGANNNNFINSTFWLYDNSRITVNRVQITYDFKSLASIFKAQSFGFYLRAGNVIMIAKNRDKIQLNTTSEPQYRSYSIGLRAKF